ncbi:MAG: amidohydrolase family protein [Clostridiaceae bacterium]|nr:amidohydrolase family protein [Clostridiaceae bacterium]
MYCEEEEKKREKEEEKEIYMSTFAIKNAIVVTCNENDEVIRDGAIIVDDNKITAVGRTKDLEEKIRECDEIIDGRDKIITPGLISVHDHVIGHVFKGFTEDGAEDYFYKHCFSMETFLNPENSYWFAYAGLMETLKFGCTMINDLFHYSQSTAEAVEDIGMKAIIQHKVFDIDLNNLQHKNYERFYDAGIKRLEENEELIKKWHNKADGRIKCWVGNHAPDTNSPELLKAGRELADKYGVGIHIHVAQTVQEHEMINNTYGMSSVKFLDSLGFLKDDVICAHLAFADTEDIAILERTGAKFAHCPVIMAKFGTFPRIKEFLTSKVPMAIGDDWVTLNPWGDMRAAIEVTRAVTGEALQYAIRAFRMMTIDAANLLNLGDETGSLEVGKKADLIVIDALRPNLVPMKDVIPSLVYNMTGNEVETVYVDGKKIVDEGRILAKDEIEVMRKTQSLAEEVWTKGGVWPE